MTTAAAAGRPASRRDQILDAAMDVFVHGGYGTSSLRSIAAAAGVTHPGVLYHFRSKEHLLAAVLERHEQQERLDFLEGPLPTTVEGFADRLATSIQREHGEPELIRLRCELAASGAVGEVAASFSSRRVERLVGELTEQVEALAPDVDAGAAAAIILATYDGLLMQGLANPSMDVGQLLRDAVSALLGDGR